MGAEIGATTLRLATMKRWPILTRHGRAEVAAAADKIKEHLTVIPKSMQIRKIF